MERITKKNEDGSESITAEDGRYRTRIEIVPTEPPYFCIEATVYVDEAKVLGVSDAGKTRSAVDWTVSALLSYREFEYPDLSIRPMARDLLQGKSDFLLELSEREWALRDDDVNPVSKTRVIFGSGSLRATYYTSGKTVSDAREEGVSQIWRFIQTLRETT